MSEPAVSPASADKPTGCLMRLMWMAVGNLAIILCLVAIFHERASRIGGIDLLYGLAVLGTIAARYVDIVRFGGTTGDGAPATLADWRRHAVSLGAAAALAWLAARWALPYFAGA